MSGEAGATPAAGSDAGAGPLRIAVLDDYQHVAAGYADWSRLDGRAEVSFFHAPIPGAALAETLSGFEALVLMRERTPFPRQVLEQLPELRLVVTTGFRNFALDVAYLRERGVVVSGTEIPGGRGGGVPSTVELAWALILAVTKRVTIEDRALRRGHWQLGMPSLLGGATLGLVGLGNLGAAMLGPARAFGMEVIAWSEHLTKEHAASLGVRAVSKEALLAESDVLSIHLVLSERTSGLFGPAELAAMKPTAVLVNTSRGPIVDEEALAEALQAGSIAGAGLDVFGREPLPAGHRLTALDNVVLLPHLGYVNESGFRAMYAQAVDDVVAYLEGSPIRSLG